MCDYSIAMAQEWQKLSTLSLELLQSSSVSPLLFNLSVDQERDFPGT